MRAKKMMKTRTSWTFLGEPLVSEELEQSEREYLQNSFAYIHEQHYRTLAELHPKMQVSEAAARLWQEAAGVSLETICRQFLGKHQRNVIVQTFFLATSLPSMSTQRYANMFSFIMGAAIWLLDYMKPSEYWAEFQTLLPAEYDDELDFGVPYVSDYEHSQDTILRVMSVLLDRGGTYRRERQAMLDFVDAEAVLQLKTAFRDALMEFFGIVLTVSKAPRQASVLETRKPELPALDKLPAGFKLNAGSILPDNQREDFLADIYLLINAPSILEKTPKLMRKDLHSRTLADKLSAFSVSDPYAICAAYLFLVRDNDVLAFMNTLTSAVMACAEVRLPWSVDDIMFEEPAAEEGRPDYSLRYALEESYYTLDEEELETESEAEPAEPFRMVSDVQLSFLATGHIPPRKKIPSTRLMRWLSKQQMSEARAREIAQGAFDAWCEQRYLDHEDELWRNDLFHEDMTEDIEDSASEEEARNAVSTAEDISSMEAQIKELTHQAKALRYALHESERTASALREQLREMESHEAADRNELRQLREALFRIKENEINDEPRQEMTIELPYQVNRRVSIFGGHDSWRKAIKPLVPGVRFCDRETLPNVDAIRNSDVVWIQANALSHKFYYRVMEAARTSDIPIRYFAYASAKKCAEQLVMDELLCNGGG